MKDYLILVVANRIRINPFTEYKKWKTLAQVFES